MNAGVGLPSMMHEVTTRQKRSVSQLPQIVTLVVLDGFGVAPDGPGNAVSQASMPNFKEYCNNYPYANLQAAGEAVGLPWGEMGNSEVGHMNLGMGRIAYQELPKINNSIRDGSFFKNEALLGAIGHVKTNTSTLHAIIMLSSGGIHSLDEHLYQFLALAKKEGLKQVAVHAILDGRDTPAKSAIEFITRFNQESERLGIGTLATLGGRYYAMDRDNRWERIEKAYQAMVMGQGEKISDPLAKLSELYRAGATDEMVEPCVITGELGNAKALITKNDAVVFLNFRTDRARQLTEAFTLPGFEKFQSRSERLQNLHFVTMVEYAAGLPTTVAFPAHTSGNTLGAVLAKNGLTQLHIAETEKFAHVTNFFDGALGTAFPGEEFLLVPSPQVGHYDEQPEMSAPEIATRGVQEISKGLYRFVIINFANPDMVGHTGNLPATIQALEALDQALEQVVTATLSLGGSAIITADHGNAEVMIDQATGQMTKEHTANPVPFVLVSESRRRATPREDFQPATLSPLGLLSDVAPTILDLFGLSAPPEMTGTSLLPLLNQDL